jgi:hypothetical protein
MRIFKWISIIFSSPYWLHALKSELIQFNLGETLILNEKRWVVLSPEAKKSTAPAAFQRVISSAMWPIQTDPNRGQRMSQNTHIQINRD